MTPSDKASAKTFVRSLRSLERAVNLPRNVFVELLDLPVRTYQSWLSGDTLPTVKRQQEILEAAMNTRRVYLGTASALLSFAGDHCGTCD